MYTYVEESIFEFEQFYYIHVAYQKTSVYAP